jgi:hypothetical protein
VSVSAAHVQIASFRPLKNTLRVLIDVILPATRQAIRDVAIHQIGDRCWIGLPSRPMLNMDGCTKLNNRATLLHRVFLRFTEEVAVILTLARALEWQRRLLRHDLPVELRRQATRVCGLHCGSPQLPNLALLTVLNEHDGGGACIKARNVFAASGDKLMGKIDTRTCADQSGRHRR